MRAGHVAAADSLAGIRRPMRRRVFTHRTKTASFQASGRWDEKTRINNCKQNKEQAEDPIPSELLRPCKQKETIFVNAFAVCIFVLFLLPVYGACFLHVNLFFVFHGFSFYFLKSNIDILNSQI